MSVYNAVGEGPPSPPQEVFVGEAGESPGTALPWEGSLVPHTKPRQRIPHIGG